MKSKYFTTIAVLAAMSLAPSIVLADNYVKASVGADTKGNNLGELTADNVSVTVGHNYNDNLSAEVEAVVLSNNAGSMFNVNANYNLTTWRNVSPFVTAGVGFAQLNNTRDTDGALVNVGVGANVAINDAWSVDLDVTKYVGVNYSNWNGSNVSNDVATVAIKYSF